MEQVTTTATPDMSKEDRGDWRERMFELTGGAMKFEARARRVFRHAPSATLVRQLLFWGDKGRDPEGWVSKTYGQWWDEEGLTRTELDTARLKLGGEKTKLKRNTGKVEVVGEGLGVLEEKHRGIPRQLYYRLNLVRLFEVMFPELDSPDGADQVPSENTTLNQSYRLQGSDKQECGVAASKSAGKRPSNAREYSKNTSKTSPQTPLEGGRVEGKGSPAPVVDALKDHERLSRFAAVARRWDFTLDEEPPFKVLARLGGTDEERYRNLKSIQSVSRRAVRGSEDREGSSEGSGKGKLTPDELEAVRREIVNSPKSAASHHAPDTLSETDQDAIRRALEEPAEDIQEELEDCCKDGVPRKPLVRKINIAVFGLGDQRDEFLVGQFIQAWLEEEAEAVAGNYRNHSGTQERNSA